MDNMKVYFRNMVNAVSMLRIWALFLFIIVRRTAFYILSKLKLAKQSIIIPELDSTNIVEIVEYLKVFFKQHEYTVNKAEYSKNGGSALLIVKRGQIKTLVLAMMHKRNVNVRQVRKAASAMKDHKCDNAIIVANQSFS
jgi:HJR/Mrr/RecB family endonuclease